MIAYIGFTEEQLQLLNTAVVRLKEELNEEVEMKRNDEDWTGAADILPSLSLLDKIHLRINYSFCRSINIHNKKYK